MSNAHSTSQHLQPHQGQAVDAALCGVGLGLRWPFLSDLLQRLESGSFDEQLPFWEIAPENYMRRGGYVPESLAAVAQHFPIISHGIQLSIGGLDPFDGSHLAGLRDFLAEIDTPWHSDHLCFSGVDGGMLHDLLPMPFTAAAAQHCAARVCEAQERLERPLLIENISYYVHPGAAELDEPQFVSRVLEAADCGLLLDVNNVYVNSLNHGFDPYRWLEQIDLTRVRQVHVAGHEYREADGLYIDTHGSAVIDPVFKLLEWLIARSGPLPVLLERDNDVPALDDLLAERRLVDAAYRRGLAQWHDRQQHHLQRESA